LSCIVGSDALPGKMFKFEECTPKFSIFRKKYLPGFGVTEYITEQD